MEIIDIVTEQTTTVTDAFVAFMAAVAAVYLHGIGQNHKWKTRIWVSIFGIYHLIQMLGIILLMDGLERALHSRTRF